MVRRILLWCGIASSVLYAAMDRIAAARWPGYDSAAQAISELSAIDAPTRPMWILPGAIYTALVCAFGWGVWKSGEANRALRITGALILAYGALGLLWPFAPMHQREVIAAGQGSLTDTMHLVLAGITVPLMLVAIGVSAFAFDRTFRAFSIATLALVLISGLLTFQAASSIEAGIPTPWMGLSERISVGAFLVWVVALSCVLLRAHPMPAARTETARVELEGLTGRNAAAAEPRRP
jgi:hypothetical protein